MTNKPGQYIDHFTYKIQWNRAGMDALNTLWFLRELVHSQAVRIASREQAEVLANNPGLMLTTPREVLTAEGPFAGLFFMRFDAPDMQAVEFIQRRMRLTAEEAIRYAVYERSRHALLESAGKPMRLPGEK